MALSDDVIKSSTRRLLLSRMRLLNRSGFFGLLLMHLRFSLDEALERPSTDGRYLVFPPELLLKLTDKEVDFYLLHEIMHIALRHVERSCGEEKERFDEAADIVVDSLIFRELGGFDPIGYPNIDGLELCAPNGKPGYLYSAEEILAMMPMPVTAVLPETEKSDSSEKPDYEKADCDGEGNSDGDGDGDGDGNVDGKVDGEVDGSGGNGGDGGGKATDKGRTKDKAPEKKNLSGGTVDDHSMWGKDSDHELRDTWRRHMLDAAESISIRDPSNTRGLMPAFMQRIIDELKRPRLDWRTLLNEFIQEEICDYSFSPPDRRFDDSPFFLPDFNEMDEAVKNILFMIDTSGSMSDRMIAEAYYEVKDAIDQFNGKLAGWLGFFDAVVVEPQCFADEEEFKTIRPEGGGGTRFDIIFDYVQKEMSDDLPVSIIILTDGYAPFPKEVEAMDIPVLWLINNEEVTPPWGKVARMVQ